MRISVFNVNTGQMCHYLTNVKLWINFVKKSEYENINYSATGTIGKHVTAALQKDHEVIKAGSKNRQTSR